MKKIFTDASISSAKLETECDKAFQVCDICASSGVMCHTKMISPLHINEAFHEELQAEFMVVYIMEISTSFSILSAWVQGTGKC